MILHIARSLHSADIQRSQ